MKDMKKKDDTALSALCAAIAAIKNHDEARVFLTDLCTPAELTAMTDRWRIVAPIKAGLSYRKIHEETGVSVTTIGRVARHITHGDGGYDLLYQRLEKKNHANKKKTSNSTTKKGSTQ